MSARVQQSLSERAVSKDDLVDAVNREILPALKQARAAINARFGQDGTVVLADYSVTQLDEFLLVDASSGPVELTLLEADDSTRELVVVKIDSSGNAVTIAVRAGETISGDVTQSLAAQWDVGRIWAIDGEYYLVSSSGGSALTFGSPVALTVGGGNVDGVSTEAARADHKHALPAFGSTAGTFAEGNDSRLSDARTPTAHAASHLPGGSDELATAAGSTIQPDDAAATGSAASFARSDHKHAIVAAAPSQGIGGGNTEGASTSFARADHDHKLRETSGPTDLTISGIANGAYLIRSGSLITGAAGGGGSYPLYFRPASPHADDEEFETTSTSLPSGWELRDFSAGPGNITPSGSYDPYTLPSANTAKIDINGWRPSWCELQIANQNRNLVFAKQPASAIGTNCLIWGRCGSYITNGGAASAEGSCMLCLTADASSHSDFDNGIFFGYRSDLGISAFTRAAAVTTERGSNITDLPPYEYFFIHKLSTTYHLYTCNDTGYPVKWASFTFATTLAWMGFYVRKNTTIALAHKMDFIRRVDTATQLPF